MATEQVIVQWLPSKAQSKIFVSLQPLTFFFFSRELVQFMVSQTLNAIRSIMMVRNELYCLNSTFHKEHLLNFLVWKGWRSSEWLFLSSGWKKVVVKGF